jgi:hypothetical protein
MNSELLMVKGFITTLPEENQLDIKNCKIAVEEVLSRYNEDVANLAIALIGLEKQED